MFKRNRELESIEMENQFREREKLKRRQIVSE